MLKKAMTAAFAAAAVLCMAIPAMASTFTSQDGILSIELPNDSWTQLQDPAKWIALSDGSNMITVEHFSNGEKLPEIVVADSHYVNTLMAAYSTQNEVFVATGFVTDPAMMNNINDALLSIKVLKYDTKQAVATSKPGSGEFVIAPRDLTMYVQVTSDGLSVRNGYSVDSTLIGSLENGTPVKVTGAVQRDGNDYGWYQIAFNNGSGFVSADYLTTTAPSAAAPGASAQPSGNTGAASGSSGNTSSNTSAAEAGGSEESTTYLVYSQGSGRPVNITGSNGVYYDGEGNVYYAAGGGNFADNSGAYYTTTMPASAPDSEVLGLVSTGSGRPVAITATEDGEFQDDEGNVYYPNEDGTFSDEYDAVYEVSGSNE